jgi:FMN phosphatase YigB (HAD superfamily)
MCVMIQPQAILFDLDCTLTDRSKSIQQFARCFAERLATAPGKTGCIRAGQGN